MVVVVDVVVAEIVKVLEMVITIIVAMIAATGVPARTTVAAVGVITVVVLRVT